MLKKTITAGLIVLALLTAFALLAGVVLGSESAVSDTSNAAAPETGSARGVSLLGPSIIGFDSDPAGAKGEPFTSVENPTVHFVDSIGANLLVWNYSPATNGQGLMVNGDDQSALVVLFDVPTTKVAILFGNDDPGWTVVGDRATLSVYRNGKRIKTVHVTMNRNDIADQVIQYSGATAIDRATLVYNRAGAPINLTEDLDDFTFKFAYSIKGTSANNTLKGDFLPNGIYGAGGNDKLFGNGGNDVLSGVAGADILTGGDGNDLLDGGSGTDVIRAVDGVGGNDTVYGGSGVDTAYIDSGDICFGVENIIVP